MSVYGPQFPIRERLPAEPGQTELVGGLPLSLCSQEGQRKALVERLRGQDVWSPLDGGDACHVTIGGVQVYPQGAGAVACALLADPVLSQRPLGLVDVGFRTVDSLILRRLGGAWAPDASLAGSADIGIGQADEAARARLEREHGILIPEGASEQAEQKYGGPLWVRGREVDVFLLVREEAKTVAEPVTNEVRRARGGTLDFSAHLP